ncbi:AAA family ATPase [Thermodesulfobacteriota bacterium]
MRIDELRLMAFGPFTDAPLNLSGGRQGFHLIYGANEAGKSSALRALRHLLYGIPERSTDDFIHPYSKMRLGAAIRSSKNQVLEFVRRKGRGNTLRTADDDSLLAETELQRYLSGVNVELFVTMFGIGHEDLVRGGQDIIKGGGDVGRLVFSAGSGIVNLREIQNDIQEKADQLFRPSGKRKINTTLGQLKNNRNELREAQLPGQEWVKHDEALRAALKRKDNVEAELIAQQKKLSRLQRIREALPLIAKRRELTEELKNYASAVLLPQDFPEKRRELITSLEVAEKGKTHALNNIETTEQVISELEIIPGLLDNSELIEELHRELGSQRKASKDRIELETRRSTLQGEAKEILRNLRDDLTLEEAEKLRIKRPETVRIQELSAKYERLITRIEDTREKLPDLIQEIDHLDKAISSLENPQPLDNLPIALKEALEYGPLERQNKSDLYEIQSALKTTEQEIVKLGFADNSAEELERLSVPSIETIQLFENRFDSAGRQAHEIRAEIKKARSVLSEVERQIETHRIEQEVPTEIDLQKAREIRNSGWHLISRKLKDEPTSEKELQDYLKTTPGSTTIAETFETNVQQADAIADRLRREADRVAAKARLLVDQTGGREQLQQFERDLEAIEQERRAVTDEWLKEWQSTGITPRTPREMERWIQDFHSLIQKGRDIGVRRTKAEALKQDIEAHRTKMIRCIAVLGRAEDLEKISLSDLIKRAQAIIDDETKLLQKHEQLKRDKALKEKEWATAKSRLETNEQDLKQWQTQWEHAVAPIGLEAEALPGQATAVMEELKSLFDKLKDAKILQKRIDGIDRDTQDFKQKVNGLVEVITIDLTARPADEAALELQHRLKRSRDSLSKQETLIKQLEKEQERIKQATEDILQINAELKSMCKEAFCESIDQLLEAERRSNTRRRIEADLKTTDQSLLQLSAGVTVGEFVKEAAAVDPDSIAGEIERLDGEIQNLSHEKSELDQTIGSERTELSKMDGSARAADLAEEIQILLGGLGNDVENYARLKIATKVLSLAIERYREKSQDPILKNASALFKQITNGSFEGIRAEYDDKGKPDIVGVRQKDKEIVSVEGMSDGTTDQLYLAFRLAGLEMYLETSEPIPFIVDDILIKFDNDRAIATLHALADISHKTQVIFFTHHRHLVELADKHINSAILFHHTL